MVDVKFPERPVRHYGIHWINDWVGRVEGLPEGEFIVFDAEDESLFNIVASKGRFELVMLVDSRHRELLRLRSLSPCVYGTSYEIIDTSPEEIKREAQEVLASARCDLRLIDMLLGERWEKSLA